MPRRQSCRIRTTRITTARTTPDITITGAGRRCRSASGSGAAIGAAAADMVASAAADTDIGRAGVAAAGTAVAAGIDPCAGRGGRSHAARAMTAARGGDRGAPTNRAARDATVAPRRRTS
ncbi:protein of unknown function [Burkholderia multivorans]